jgi:hypothetical protein
MDYEGTLRRIYLITLNDTALRVCLGLADVSKMRGGFGRW